MKRRRWICTVCKEVSDLVLINFQRISVATKRFNSLFLHDTLTVDTQQHIRWFIEKLTEAVVYTEDGMHTNFEKNYKPNAYVLKHICIT